MTKKISRQTSVTAFLVFLAALSQSETQALVEHKSKDGASQVVGQSILKIVKKTGWSLPGSPETLGTSKAWTTSLGSSAVLKRQLQLSSEPLYTLERFIVEDRVLVISSQTCVVREIYALEVARRVFAYEAVLVQVELLNDGRRQYVGTAYRLYFYDDDGDGIFESRYTSLPSQVVPNWARDK